MRRRGRVRRDQPAQASPPFNITVMLIYVGVPNPLRFKEPENLSGRPGRVSLPVLVPGLSGKRMARSRELGRGSKSASTGAAKAVHMLFVRTI